MPENTPKEPLFSSKLYDMLKFVAQILLPALATLYLTIGALYQFTGAFEPEKVVGLIVALDTFLGVVLGISTKTYNNSDAKYHGSMDLVPNAEGTPVVTLNLEKTPEALSTQGDILLKNNLPQEF
jgi:hypothetical protein